MPKRTLPTHALPMRLDQRLSEPLYRQLYERLHDDILAGKLEPGARLPSTRTLASELGVSRNTTALAYQLLVLEGYIEGRVGDGTRVAHMRPSRDASTGAETPTEPRAQSPAAPSRRAQTLMMMPHPGARPERMPDTLAQTFRLGQPDTTLFPYETWARLAARHARHTLPRVALYQHVEAQGYRPLREAIAARLGITRGVRCTARQIILTSGSQGALDLVGRVLLDPGDAAWVEDPGYLGARGALLASEAHLVPVPVDAEGLNVAAGHALSPRARLAVVTPSHQFPTGVTMSLRRRLALLEWARAASAWIAEDDYDSEFRYSGRPLEALQGMDTTGHVVYVGTFSKVLFPSLRLGYLVVPPALVDSFVATRGFIDTHLPLLDQLVLADFIGEGHYVRHVRAMRQVYLERRNTLTDALSTELGDMLTVTAPEAGLHLAAWLPPGMSATGAARRIAAHGEEVTPIVQRGSGVFKRDGLMLGFAAAGPERIRLGVRAIARALRAS
ncbi:MAG TPA: PLP-dependent aminotransferase family protein [Ktedonobacterales bacterium]